MTDTQHKAVAAGFVHALAESSETRTEFMAAKGDGTKVGALVQKTMGLATPPSTDDLKAMSSHVRQHLQPQVEKVKAADAAVADHVGMYGLTQS